MTTIFEALRRDHDTQRALLSKLAETHGDSPERRSLFTLLKEELKNHAKYEERYFYKQLMNYDLTQEKARHSVHEHHEIDEKLEKVEETDFKAPAWLSNLKNLKECVEHHLNEEEKEIFTVAGKVLDREKKHKLAYKYGNEMQENYTSP